MTGAFGDRDAGANSTVAAVQPLERAQLVWRRAVTLTRSEQGPDRFVALLDLLRTAHHGPSTMRHALALGRAQQRATPGDLPTRNAVRLLARTIRWLGTPIEKDEVGTTRSGSRSRATTHPSPPGVAPQR